MEYKANGSNVDFNRINNGNMDMDVDPETQNRKYSI